MFSYSQSIGRPGTSLPTLYYLSNVYALKLLVPTSTNTKKLIISHWCYFQFELILPHGTMVLKCTPKRRNAFPCSQVICPYKVKTLRKNILLSGETGGGPQMEQHLGHNISDLNNIWFNKGFFGNISHDSWCV